MFPKTPHAISLLKEARDDYVGERTLLQKTDSVKSAQRIDELFYFINDINITLELLEKMKE